jgi:hypothetical protein
MIRVALIAWTLLAAMAWPAAAQSARNDLDQSPALVIVPADLPVSLGQAATGLLAASRQRPPLPPPAPPPLPVSFSSRRRGSMVGYLEEATVSSQIRVRFDAGLHSHTPDRAEFFYAKCGCYRDLATNDPAYDPDAAGPGPGVVGDLNFQQLYVQGEYAAGPRFSVFAELPLRWLQPKTPGAFANQSGLADLRAGVKLALVDTASQVLTGQVKAFLPTGDSRKGLGTNHTSIEPALIYSQAWSDRGAIESQVSLWMPIGGSDGVPVSSDDKFSGNVLTYGIGPSFDVYRSNRVRLSPVVELVGWRVLSGFQTTTPGDASGTNIVNLKFGARASWGTGGSIYAGYGRALTEADWYNDIVRVEYRYSF